MEGKKKEKPRPSQENRASKIFDNETTWKKSDWKKEVLDTNRETEVLVNKSRG